MKDVKYNENDGTVTFTAPVINFSLTTALKVGALKYEVVPCLWLDEAEIRNFVFEARKYHEEMNVLWQLDEMTVREWKAWLVKNQHAEGRGATEYHALLADERMVGVFRVTPEPNHEANGKLGVYVRPSERGHGVGTMLVAMATELCRRERVRGLTACIDVENEASLRAFTKAGWQLTGRAYEWKPVESRRYAVEFMPPEEYARSVEL